MILPFFIPYIKVRCSDITYQFSSQINFVSYLKVLLIPMHNLKTKLIPTNASNPSTYKLYVARLNRQTWRNKRNGPEMQAVNYQCKNCPICKNQEHKSSDDSCDRGIRRYYFDKSPLRHVRSLPVDDLPGARSNLYDHVKPKIYTGLGNRLELPPLKRIYVAKQFRFNRRRRPFSNICDSLFELRVCLIFHYFLQQK